MTLSRLSIVLLALALAPAGPAASAPRVPQGEDTVIERLPIRATDPLARELRGLREEVVRDPNKVEAAVRLARRYFDLASAEGDPRYVGYAEAVIRPWVARPVSDPSILLVRALLRQYRHDFAAAMTDLDAVIRQQPTNTEAMLWQFALHLVQADYPAARASCEQAAAHATPLSATACRAVVDSINGKSRQAYAALSAALVRDPTRDLEYRQWALTRLAEMALRLGDRRLSERHFREAIATGIRDGFVLAAYADLLLEEQRQAEVITLLKNHVASDILLLRLAIAEDRIGAPAAAQLRKTLADRFAASALRGDALHQQEEARFELELRRDAVKSLAKAAENWKHQREPRDALILMESARAAGRPDAAKAALDWMAATGYEDPRYRTLATALRESAAGATGSGRAEASPKAGSTPGAAAGVTGDASAGTTPGAPPAAKAGR
jgi:hypothetical protein